MEATVTQPQEFVNDLIRCTVSLKPGCTIEFKVKASEKLVNESKAAAAKMVGKSVTLPGFRRGKAPESLVKEKFADSILKESQKHLARRAYIECQNLTSVTNLDPKGTFSYNTEKRSDEETELVLSFETSPTIPVVDVSLCTLNPVIRPEVNEEKVKETIRQALFFYAKWDTISGKPVSEGDFVILDGEIVNDEGTVLSSVFKGTRFEVTEKSMARWMKDAILGKNKDESVVAVSVADEDVPEEEKLLFQPQKVKLTIKEIEKVELPELSAELLEKMSVSSEAELKDRIEKQLIEQADKHVEENLREQALSFLVQKYPFDLPKSLVNREIEFRTRQLSSDGDFMNHWTSLGESERQKMMQLIVSRAETSIRLSLLCTDLLAKAKIALPSSTTGEGIGRYSEQILTKATDYIISQLTGATVSS